MGAGRARGRGGDAGEHSGDGGFRIEPARASAGRAGDQEAAARATSTPTSIRGCAASRIASGRVNPALFEGRKRGVIFDVGHGGGSFLWRIAVPAMKEGFLPDSISTDLHIGSMNAGMKDMLNVMDKFLAMGMSLDDVMLRSTWNPAREIKPGGTRAPLGRRRGRRRRAARRERQLRLRRHVRRADGRNAAA